MNGRRRWILFLAAAVTLAATAYVLLAVPRPITLREESERFQFYFDGLSGSALQPIVESLEENYGRIVGDLGLASMPVVRVKVWRSRAGFYDEMEGLLGVRYSGSDGYVYGAEELHIMLVSDAPTNAVHEFAHVASLNLNPTLANNPRWLWEAVALYEAGQFVHPARLSYMAAGDYPSIQELDSDFGTGGDRVYAVGYLLAEYVVDNWGMEALRALIEANGDTRTALETDLEAFEGGWHEWLEDKYLSQ